MIGRHFFCFGVQAYCKTKKRLLPSNLKFVCCGGFVFVSHGCDMNSMSNATSHKWGVYTPMLNISITHTRV